MRSLLSILMALLLLGAVNAQDASLQVISSAGGFGVSGDNSISLSWTLGELVISTVVSDDNQLILTQGFQQSKLLVKGITVYPDLGITITVYPNPTSEILYIRLASPLEGKTVLHISGPDGREVFNDEIPEGDLLAEVNMQSYAPGTYFLRIQNGIKLNVYKIIKL